MPAVDLALPDSLDRAHDHGADQHEAHFPARRVEEGAGPLVPREKPSDVRGRVEVDAEELPGDVGEGGEPSLKRHVDPVVVRGREVDGEVGASLERAAELRVSAEERGEGEVLALGLDERSCRHRPRGALRAVRGAEHRARIRIERAGACPERPREELVEGRVLRGILLLALGHVHMVVGDEPFDGEGGDGPHPAPGEEAGCFREQLLRGGVLDVCLEGA